MLTFLAELIYQTESVKCRIAIEDLFGFKDYQSRIYHLLQPLPFNTDNINLYRFTGRKWVFNKINEWINNPNAKKILWITGKPGIGKTAISAWLCRYHGSISASHFCRHDETERADPCRFVRSIAYQLGFRFLEYYKQLHIYANPDIIVDPDYKKLFNNLIKEPFHKAFQDTAGDPGRKVIILIDALDEAIARNGENTLAPFIDMFKNDAPSWFRLIVTSRPELNLECFQKDCEIYKLDNPNDLSLQNNNREDFRKYLGQNFYKDEVNSDYIDQIITNSGDAFLYIEQVRRGLALSEITNVDEFPNGLIGIYEREFRRRFSDIRTYKNRILPILEMISAAREPLTVDLIAYILGLSRGDREELNQLFGPLFPINEKGEIRPFHKTIFDWLIEGESDKYHIDTNKGHEKLANGGWNEYIEKGADSISPYMLAYLPFHLKKAEKLDNLKEILSDEIFTKTRYKRKMIFNVVEDLHSIRSQEDMLIAVCETMVKALETRSLEDRISEGTMASESFRMTIRSALNHFFIRYSEWPEPIITNLENSSDPDVMIFIGDTLDMERRFDDAENIFSEILQRINISNPAYPAACIRFSVEKEHKKEHEIAICKLDKLISELDELISKFDKSDIPQQHKERYCEDYWWAHYQKAINLIGLGREYHEEAIDVLNKVHDNLNGKERSTSALHQLGVIDLEKEKFEEAEKKFKQCLSERSNYSWNHRKAYEYRRLGEVYALTKRVEEAKIAYDEAEKISIGNGNQRYVTEVQKSRKKYLGQ